MAALGKGLTYTSGDQVGLLRQTSPGVWGEGYGAPPIDAFDNSVWMANPLDMSEHRGASGEITIVAGSTLAIPDGQVVGQRRNITFIGGATQFSEMIITGKFRGYGRNSQHKLGSVQDTAIVRADENIQLVWMGAYHRIIASNPCLFPRPTVAFPTIPTNWEEHPNGTVSMVLFSSGNPVGATYPLSQAIVFPITLANAVYYPNIGFSRGGVGALPQGQDAGYADFTSRTITGFNTVRLADTAGGSIIIFVEGAVANYAALGGVASF